MVTALLATDRTPARVVGPASSPAGSRPCTAPRGRSRWSSSPPAVRHRESRGDSGFKRINGFW